ncbi:MAG: hypothetical protein V4536_02905 [Pseudomonadota bacterium]
MTTDITHSSPHHFSVDVFSERRSLNQSPWLCIGKFECLTLAIKACKTVVDEFLEPRSSNFNSADELVTDFLQHGEMPAITGADNLKHFDIYDYLSKRCREIYHTKTH